MFNKDPNLWEKFFASITFRLLVIGFLILILLIPLASVKDLIRERQLRSKDVTAEISSKWGRKQTLTGPVLTIPYEKEIEIFDKKTENYVKKVKTEYLNILPEALHYACEILPETRYRGIFKVIVFKAYVSSEGSFKLPDLKELDIEQEALQWQNAQLSFRLSDLRSLEEEVDFTWAGTKCNFASGTMQGLDQGVNASVKLDPQASNWDFQFQLGFNGSSELMFTPLGKTTIVKVTSTWSDPSFTGSFLPDKRDVNDNGFTADWKVLHLNRPIKQVYTQSNFIPLENDYNFGVELFLPVDHYMKSERSIKYAVLLIFLTFISFLAISTFIKVKIHPLQYLLIGFSLCVFYSLLISISEHAGFDAAYWLAALATIVLLVLYSGAVLSHRKFALILGTIILILYAFIFVIIQLQDYALLVGSIGLFTVIALLMYLSVKLKILK